MGSTTTRFFFFFFNDTATTEIYTLSLHDALPILPNQRHRQVGDPLHHIGRTHEFADQRSEEHTSELQSHLNLVCRLLLEKKKISTHTELSHVRIANSATRTT